MGVKNGRPGQPRARLRLHVAPDPELGAFVRHKVLAFTSTQGLDEADVADFVAAVGEALANAIEHGGSQAPIEIVAWMEGDDRLFASVRDQGVGFTPGERPPSIPPDAMAERGRGLPIMRSYADSLDVTSTPGCGTRVTLGRRVHRAGRAHVPRRSAG